MPAPKVVPKAAPAPKVVPKAAPAPQAAPEPKDTSSVVAQIGQKSLTLNQLNQLIKAQLEQAEQEYQQKLYELRANMIDEYLSDAALKLELAQQKQSDIRVFLESEVVSKIPPITDDEINQFFEENKARLAEMPESEVRPQIEGFLTQQKARGAVQAYVQSIRQKHKATDLLEPPRIKVEAKGFSKGPEDAPITIVEFADYECGYCGKAMENLELVMKKYPGKIKLIYRDFPLDFHPNAIPASIAARCAGAQGKFWEMHTKLFQNQSALTAANFMAWAKELGLNQTQFETCSKDDTMAVAIQADTMAGSSVGVTGTPAFFVNGILLSGAQPPEAFSKIIDRELARANRSK